MTYWGDRGHRSVPEQHVLTIQGFVLRRVLKLGAMEERALELLDFPVILDRLESAAASEPGKALARAASPSPDPEEIAWRQATTTEAIAVLDRADEPELGGAADVRETVESAERGAVLDPGALRAIARTVRAGVAARRSIVVDPASPLLTELVTPIDEADEGLVQAIDKAVDEDGGDLRDDASPKLRSLRRELRDGRARLADRLRKLARDPALEPHLQDDFVTERAGRPVLALRASARGAVPGIVHDTSGSGQTLFVEPFAVVDDSNRLREAEGAEREEVVRILRDLSRAVGQRARSVIGLVEAIAELDLAFARGTLSRGWHGAPVTIAEDVVLKEARHPLLARGDAVPIELDLGHLRALVISGPNTGGKTVALKTLGLAVVLHQTGLRPPAAEARLPVFDRVLVDIGDEQSIAMSLSTFSGHVRNLVEILDAATERSLVLLDELAAGTDPVEGAALAQALLGRLAGQARLTLATSHYAELKEWASATDAVANAATALDPGTNEPLYRLTIGRPGTSHALQTAGRLGLPESLIGEARARIDPDRLRVGQLLADAEEAERRAAEELDRAASERSAIEQARVRADERARELERQIEAVRASAQAERDRAVLAVEEELAGARRELDALRDEVRMARRSERARSGASGPRAREQERERDRRLGAASAHAAAASQEIDAFHDPPVGSGPIAPGDAVVAPAIGIRGTVIELGPAEATVLGRGGLRARVPIEQLRRDAGPGSEHTTEAVTVHAEVPVGSPSEVDLRGLTSREARETVRAFVDQAALAGHREVRVIHGRGTGAVRSATRDELARHPLVDSTESDSADGATLVRLG